MAIQGGSVAVAIVPRASLMLPRPLGSTEGMEIILMVLHGLLAQLAMKELLSVTLIYPCTLAATRALLELTPHPRLNRGVAASSARLGERWQRPPSPLESPLFIAGSACAGEGSGETGGEATVAPSAFLALAAIPMSRIR